MRFETYETELRNLFIDLCKISSETNHEESKILYIVNWYMNNGLMDFELDSAGNVLYFFGVKAYNPIKLFAAHVDTVFSSDILLEPRVEDDVLYCPGSGDNTANLAVMMMTVKYLSDIGYEPPCGLIFAADVCEEGLGNLKGVKTIVGDYGVRIEEMVALDLSYGTIIDKAVGSKRYEIRVSTKGGHAYHNFGSRSAISVAADIVSKLYGQKLPVDNDATYNVGKITGGTGVNVIAESCKLYYEIRSTSKENLDFLESNFNHIVDGLISNEVSIECEVIGERPCMGDVDKRKQQFLFDRAIAALNSSHWSEAGYPFEGKAVAGSTDCNVTFSKGIPSICFGLAYSEGHHTLNEFTRLDSLIPGMKRLVSFVIDG